MNEWDDALKLWQEASAQAMVWAFLLSEGPRQVEEYDRLQRSKIHERISELTRYYPKDPELERQRAKVTSGTELRCELVSEPHLAIRVVRQPNPWPAPEAAVEFSVCPKVEIIIKSSGLSGMPTFIPSPRSIDDAKAKAIAILKLASRIVSEAT